MLTIGKYQLQHVIGRGGMGTVYEALDPLINRKVAVKTMTPGLADSPDLRARFLREAQAAGGLRHRNIVTVYDLGEDKGQPYIAMEFIEGTDLEKIIQNKQPFSIEWKLDVIRQVCEGLGYAHRAGIVHRDVKPANIRVTPDDEVKIMDFGIAHLQSSTMTKSGLVLGTIHYMAPEQIQGQKVDHRADIFSVGVIAYELIAHRRPFDGESLTAVMFKVMHEPPDPEGLPRTEYSPGLEAIVLKALAREPQVRYQSLDEMHSDLERLVRETAPKVIERGSAQASASGGVETVALMTADVQKDELRQAEEALRRRVEKELGEIHAEMERARREGQLQRALGLSHRLLELSPEDEAVARACAQIQEAIQDKEVEQLCGLALSYATDGEMELAWKISARIERLAPQSPRFQTLKSYLDEEAARRTADALTATAGDHLALGNLAEALASVEEALAVYPTQHAAREIRDRVAGILGRREEPAAFAAEPARRPAPEPVVATATATPPPTPARERAPNAAPVSSALASPGAPEPLTPLPEGEPASAEAAALVDTARRLLRERSPEKAVAPLEQAAALEPGHAGIARILTQTRSDARKAEIEALTTAALDSFVQNDYRKARQAVEKALALDPKNKKARELSNILGALH